MKAHVPEKVLVFADEADFYCDALHEHFAALRGNDQLRRATTRDEAMQQLPGCDTLVMSGARADDALLARGDALRWVQATTSGVDTLLLSRTLPGNAVVTSARGVHGPQMAELALLLMMSLARDFPRMLAQQRTGEWDRWPQPILAGKHVVIVGVGTVGEALAARCKAMEMRVTGIASARRDVPGFDDIRTRAELPDVLPHADFVVVLLPRDSETTGLVDAAFLAAMPPHAILVNLGRGGVVDEAALHDALHTGRIAAAGLDVFETEPLPADHPLRALPNLIVTPHIGGFSDAYAQQVLPVLVDNMTAMLAGKPERLQNRIR